VAPVSPESVDLEATLAATRWLAAVGVESHLDFDQLFEIAREPGRLQMLAAQRRHLRACGACRRQWLELRAQAGNLGAALPASRPPTAAGWRDTLIRLWQLGSARFAAMRRVSGLGGTGAGWAVAAIAGMSMVIVSVGESDRTATQRVTAQAMSPADAALLLRSLGPQAAPYGLILESQGLEALERRLREDESRSPIALHARCLLLKRENCR